jgi:hypothetical protein
MEDMHGSKFAGHPSERKMVAKLKRYAVWPNMGVDVAEFVTRCAICDKLREPMPGNKTPLQPIVAEDVFRDSQGGEQRAREDSHDSRNPNEDRNRNDSRGRQQYSTRGRQEYRDRRDFNNGQTSGGNQDRNKRGFRRREDSRDQRRRERPKDDGTIFTTRKERRKARKTEREARFTFTRKTKSKEEKLGAAEIVTDDENSDVEVDSDYEALCERLDQQKKEKSKAEKNL